jgi:pimeloyl-ACP methyl ester carboxylesterase
MTPSSEHGVSPDPRAGTRPVTLAGDGITFAGLRWAPTGAGPGLGRMAVLLHGVQSGAVTTARTAQALAADGWNAVALDMPGHGATVWLDGDDDAERYGRANVARLVGDAVGTVAARPVLVGHSWGGDIALAIAASGQSLAHVVVIDPPVVDADVAGQLAREDLAELRPGDLDAARAVVAAGRWRVDPLDAEAKAQALTTISPIAVEAVYRRDWRPQVDARRWRDLPDPPPLDLIAADPAAGGLIPIDAIDELRSILGDDHVHFMPGASHSPQRTDFDRLWPLLRSLLG